jgi:hypothetical protein
MKSQMWILTMHLSLIVTVGHAAVVYDACLGSLPEDQGFAYSDLGGNPKPTVDLCQLRATSLTGNQFWSISDTSITLSSFVLEAVLRVESSNHTVIATGTREGYYLGVVGPGGEDYIVGLADDGFNINSIQRPQQPLMPYPIASIFHTYRLEVVERKGSFYIDNVLVAGDISPSALDAGTDVHVFFGGRAGVSRSVTDLRSFCYDSRDASSCAAAVPEPSSAVLCGIGLVFAISVWRWRSRRSLASKPY